MLIMSRHGSITNSCKHKEEETIVKHSSHRLSTLFSKQSLCSSASSIDIPILAATAEASAHAHAFRYRHHELKLESHFVPKLRVSGPKDMRVVSTNSPGM